MPESKTEKEKSNNATKYIEIVRQRQDRCPSCLPGHLVKDNRIYFCDFCGREFQKVSSEYLDKEGKK